jgi:HPt (histidine-containing phosphotransfer) domain-containing protein
MASPRHGHGHDEVFEPDVATAIALRFDGDAALYKAFATDCEAQFIRDAGAGEAACEGGDLPALRRLAHNLKSALVMLGHQAISDVAAEVERQAAAGDPLATRAAWRRLHSMLLRLKIS